MRKKSLLVILIFIFLCACSFVGGQPREKDVELEELQFLRHYDKIVKHAEEYASKTTNAIVQSVYQHQDDSIWKIEFTDGFIVLYDEENGELTHTKN
ncbi:hypothetical protein [Bacillus pinisoli]|uniref:hypothetical protein n=1 Tax=Bacillus pinisoli TaxID=2901866 RepID=UPI001FF4F1FD|nr:hypothetical protein [Bacillus pinisoli]